MTAVVTIPVRGSDSRTETVRVPKANGYEVDDQDRLHLRTSPWGGGDKIAMFKRWESVVIEPDRGPNGKFVKRER